MGAWAPTRARGLEQVPLTYPSNKCDPAILFEGYATRFPGYVVFDRRPSLSVPCLRDATMDVVLHLHEAFEVPLVWLNIEKF